jgi:hypothetical protein
MNDIKNSARLIAHTLLSHEKENRVITDEIILNIIDRVETTMASIGQVIDKNELFKILIDDFRIGKGGISILSDDLKPWLYEKKADINWELWNRYKLFMKEKDPSFPLDDLDDFTDKILDKCVNPKQEGSWDRRGMVVGHVQSGKTSNYVGLINKATDAGYKVIIVIAGTISSLRRQTQERIDEGFTGISSSDFILKNQGNNVGVGKYKVNSSIYPLTSSFYLKGDEGDLGSKTSKIPIGNNPVVFVIKKNKGILEHLINWFAKDENIKIINGQPKLIGIPALVIDDEADAASVNATKDINEIKTINKLIRTLLNIFDQNTFIGYTATPYANLFIPKDFNDELTTDVKGKTYFIGEDLFPKDFIINITAPKNYIGAAKIFGLENPITGESHEPLNLFRVIDDYDPPFFKKLNKNNKDDLPSYLPESLEIALKSFILTCAIRRLRGQKNKHNSMLVHVALYVKWIDKVALLVNERMKDFKNYISANDSKFLKELEELFINDFVPTTESIIENIDYKDSKIEIHDWANVKTELQKAASKIYVRSVHGTRSTTKLEYKDIDEIDYSLYDDGFSVIAVGGGRLARGITLEGLSTSYYLRTTRMYDSLMQMGRWFGYRPGYVDLCRLFTTENIYEWFNHITLATEEMRCDFDEMTTRNLKPKDFTLKVRNHHGLTTLSSMMITSAGKINKDYTETLELSFSNSNKQTYLLLKDKKSIENNFNIFKNLFKRLGFPKDDNIIPIKNKIKYLLYRNVKIDILTDFIENYKINIPSINNQVLSDYIKQQDLQKNIREWNICIVSNTNERALLYDDGVLKESKYRSEHEIKKYSLFADGKEIELVCSVRNQTEPNTLYKITKNQIDDVVDRQVDLSEDGIGSIKERRADEGKGLLLIYALDERGTTNIENGKPIIGYSLHFPKIENEAKVVYTATKNTELADQPMEDDDNSENE